MVSLFLVGELEEGLLCYRKIKSKGNVASNYRPITCLPLMWKLLTGVIADQICAHLDQEKLLPEEQKGCRKGSRGTNDLLYIDRAVIQEVKSTNKNLAMAWIDYKKAYGSTFVDYKMFLDLFGVAGNIKFVNKQSGKVEGNAMFKKF